MTNLQAKANYTVRIAGKAKLECPRLAVARAIKMARKRGMTIHVLIGYNRANGYKISDMTFESVPDMDNY